MVLEDVFEFVCYFQIIREFKDVFRSAFFSSLSPDVSSLPGAFLMWAAPCPGRNLRRLPGKPSAGGAPGGVAPAEGVDGGHYPQRGLEGGSADGTAEDGGSYAGGVVVPPPALRWQQRGRYGLNSVVVFMFCMFGLVERIVKGSGQAWAVAFRMRWPIQWMTGTAMELLMALYRWECRVSSHLWSVWASGP